MDLHLIFALMVAFQLKHFLADFLFQTQFMVDNKTNADWSFVGPLAIHCSVHLGFTLLIILVTRPEFWWLAILDFVAHFVMDRIKAGPKYLGRFSDMQSTSFWNALGFDQMFHHLTHYFIIFILLS